MLDNTVNAAFKFNCLISSSLFIFFSCALYGQTVTKVTTEQNGTALHIHYTLQTDDSCEVHLFVSLNGGKSWTGPLLRVSGDVGKDITAGDHTIRWEVLEEQEQLVGNNIQFKVVANGKKWFEPEMVFVKGGTFLMGSNSGNGTEKPLHQVELSDFSIGKYEVTQKQWIAVMGNNPSKFSGCDECPVENVSWNGVQKFIKKLNLITGRTYRLPTEAEWEYAAKGGRASMGYPYSGSSDIGRVAWVFANSNHTTHPVGSKIPNELGIYDMSGNVFEWCSDWFGMYSANLTLNPKGGSPSDEYKVYRGASYFNWKESCNVTYRLGALPENGDYSGVGFRLVLASVR